MVNNVLFFGNPGSGKSTLLNALLNNVDPNEQAGRFKSGVSLATGLTEEYKRIVAGDAGFIDSPGLADIRKREHAAVQITEALKVAGHCRVFFVVTLESGRVRPEDCATIHLILESCPDIRHYGLIFNKVSPKLLQSIAGNVEEAVKQWLLEMHPSFGADSVMPYPLIIPNILQLEDEEDVGVSIPSLNKFHDVLPFCDIDPANVKPIKANMFESLKEQMQAEMAAIRNDNVKMRQRKAELEERIIQEESASGGNFFAALAEGLRGFVRAVKEVAEEVVPVVLDVINLGREIISVVRPA